LAKLNELEKDRQNYDAVDENGSSAAKIQEESKNPSKGMSSGEKNSQMKLITQKTAEFRKLSPVTDDL
jgi:hypothetical protein